MNSFSDQVHLETHVLRMTTAKPTMFEQKMSRMVAEEYQDECKECKQKAEQYKYQPVQSQEKQGFMGGLFK